MVIVNLIQTVLKAILDSTVKALVAIYIKRVLNNK